LILFNLLICDDAHVFLTARIFEALLTKNGTDRNRGNDASSRFSEPAFEALTDYLVDTIENWR
jgi:hypothetical protein